jgi:mannose-6-phosphate isomerase-like protein (cupin superfamily)
MNMQFNHQENLNRIRQLVETFAPFDNLYEKKDGNVEYKTTRGKVYGKNIFNIGNIAVQAAVLEKDSAMPAHENGEIEIFIVYEGDFELEMKDGIIKLGVGDIIKIEPNRTHLPSSINGCKIIAITIPSSKGYPSNE